MTKRDLFILALKLFGVFSIISGIFTTLPGNASIILTNFDLISIILIVGILVVYIGLFVLLILKAGYLVDKLRLPKGFDEERIDLGNLDSPAIIKISLMIIGGLLFINNIPIFLSYLVYSFKAEQIGITSNNDYLFKLGVSAINIIIGYLIFTNTGSLSKVLNKEE
jgi:hypothetical protein